MVNFNIDATPPPKKMPIQFNLFWIAWNDDKADQKSYRKIVVVSKSGGGEKSKIAQN